MKSLAHDEVWISHLTPEDDLSQVLQTIVTAPARQRIIFDLVGARSLFQQEQDFRLLHAVQQQRRLALVVPVTHRSDQQEAHAQAAGIPLFADEQEAACSLLGNQQPRDAGVTLSAAASAPVPVRRAGSIRWSLWVGLFPLLATLAMGISLFLLPPATAPSPPPLTRGHLSFLNSEQVSQNSNQGIADQVVLDLSSVPPPKAGMSFFGWLQGANSTLALGPLTVEKGRIHVFYAGDVHHRNLLAFVSGLLITEEPSTPPPVLPSVDRRAWRFAGTFDHTQPPVTGEDAAPASQWDALRSLLATDPTLDALHLPGGFSIWFATNTSKVFEWATSVRQAWEDGSDLGFVRRQCTRILTYLESSTLARQELAPGTPLLVNERFARIGLVQPPGEETQQSYITAIMAHLDALLQTTPQDLPLARSLQTALNEVQDHLSRLRQETIHLLHLSDQHMQHPSTLTLLNEMISEATSAYLGGFPPDGQPYQGARWISQTMTQLATLEITALPASSP